MPLPLLDQDSYSNVCDEWVQYAGELLRSAGYLHADPTGSYDADFAAAVDAFQQANGIAFEPNQVGPYTWAALGASDTGTPGDGAAQHTSAQYDYGSHHQGNYWHDEDTIHQGSDHPATVAADPGLEVVAGGKAYIIYPDEVRQGGSVAWRGRNPGNIRNGDSYGAYPGKKLHAGSNGTFAIFPDEETGFAAIKLVLQSYGHITVQACMNKYAPASDHNDPTSYAATVAKKMGVTTDTYVDTLDDGQLDTFAQAIKQVEGWIEGHTHPLDDAALPEAVKKAIAGQ
jgi:Putative peptidoglycan binding domain